MNGMAPERRSDERITPARDHQLARRAVRPAIHIFSRL